MVPLSQYSVLTDIYLGREGVLLRRVQSAEDD